MYIKNTKGLCLTAEEIGTLKDLAENNLFALTTLFEIFNKCNHQKATTYMVKLAQAGRY